MLHEALKGPIPHFDQTHVALSVHALVQPIEVLYAGSLCLEPLLHLHEKSMPSDVV